MIRKLAVPAAALVLAASVALAHPPGHRPAAPSAPVVQPPASGAAQADPQGRNLQVLPAGIPQERLMMIMRHWSQALGVQCSYCHTPPDFKSDANPHKNIARGMVRMTVNINNEQLPTMVGASAQPRVNCYTCHRGSPRPDTEPPPPPEIAPPAPPGVAPPPQVDRPPPAHIAPDTPARPY